MDQDDWEDESDPVVVCQCKFLLARCRAVYQASDGKTPQPIFVVPHPKGCKA